MAIENTYLLGKNITLGCGFDLQAKAPLDSRQVVPAFAGLQALINYDAAFEGMIVYDEETKKTYQAQKCDPYTVTVGEGEDAKEKTYDIAFREFGINESELRELIASETTAAMEFKGGTATLPENPAKGDMYKVTAEFAVGEETAKVGDSIVYNGEQWFLIPSGDDIEDTWRPVTDVNNDASLTFVAGDKLDVTVASTGEVTYKHEAIDAPTATPVGEDEQTRTYITSVETDGFGHIVGYKTATENVEDTNTTYEFEGQSDEATSVYFQVKSSEAEAAEVIYLDTYSKNEADVKFGEAIEAAKTDAANQDAVILAEAQAYADGKDAAIEAAQKAADDVAAYVGTFTHDTAKTVVEYVDAKTDGIATVSDLEALGQRVTAAEGDVNTIKSDYVKAADIADFETKENVQKVADALAGVKATAEAAATKVYTDEELAKKVDKVDGKDLIATSEIERLATLHNYDDTQVKADIAKKADAETMTTELGKKVDKVEGYSLVSDAEIERLGTLHNYDDTALAGRVTTAEGKITALEGASATHATKDELKGVDDKFANYVTSESYGVDKKATEDALADRYTKSEADGKFALIADAYDDTALSNRVKAIEDDYLKGEHKTALEGLITAEQQRAEGIEGGLRTDVDAIKGDYLKATDKTELEGKITANANAIELLTNGVSADEVDGVNDLINYVKEHGTEVTGMQEDIAANTKAIGDEAVRADAAEKALAGRLDTLEAIDHDAYVAADTALKTELEGKIADAKTDAANQDAVILAEAQAFTEDKVKALADGAVAENTAAIATKANSADVYGKEETFTKDEVNAAIEAALTAANSWGEF